MGEEAGSWNDRNSVDTCFRQIEDKGHVIDDEIEDNKEYFIITKLKWFLTIKLAEHGEEESADLDVETKFPSYDRRHYDMLDYPMIHFQGFPEFHHDP